MPPRPLKKDCRAPSMSSDVTSSPPLLAVLIAASLTIAHNSAPLVPGVIKDTRSRLRSSLTFNFFVCTFRIARRPFLSGRGHCTMRSNLPALNRAGSSSSNLLVAAITTTPLLEVSRPSIHVKIWLRVVSCSEFMLPMLRARPMESISSMNTMDGAALAACLKSVRTRAGPLPTNTSTKSLAEQAKNGTLASAAVTRASSVFPLPGGPTNNTPAGRRAPTRLYRAG
mmetsp:Transcript_32186/g.43959  ORF Transcript_32186/g.43959 Transcript_32186/m.43959 type:complete len:226 (-) Transcript_32186:463-1140(-)